MNVMSPFSIRIALVDDYLPYRRELAALLQENSGFSVTIEAVHGQDLIRQLGPTTMPDLVLLDVCMPVMDGLATARWLATHYPQLKILMLSTEDNPAILRQLRESGIKGYVSKTASYEELRSALETVQAGSYYFPESIRKQVLRYHQIP